jgi:hypothetical protein
MQLSSNSGPNFIVPEPVVLQFAVSTANKPFDRFPLELDDLFDDSTQHAPGKLGRSFQLVEQLIEQIIRPRHTSAVSWDEGSKSKYSARYRAEYGIVSPILGNGVRQKPSTTHENLTSS